MATKHKVWLSAFRLRTLPLALSGIILGTLLAFGDGFFNPRTFVFSILTAGLLQILSNLANDLGDTEHGADNADRVGPMRAVQSGSITKRQMKNAVILLSILAFISGLSLLYYSFTFRVIDGTALTNALLFLGIGILAIAAAIKYTMGKNPYGYRAMGDIFVFLFFGIVAVMGIYYLYCHQIRWAVLMPACSMGLLSAAVLNLNNMRDAVADKKVGKITIPIKLGVAQSHRYHQLLFILAFILATAFIVFHSKLPFGLLFLLLLPIVFLHIKKVKRVYPAELNPELKKIALFTLAFSLLLGIGYIIS